MAQSARSDVRLAEMIASLSLATDLGLGVPQEHVLRQTVIATRLAAAADMSTDAQAATFYVSLLAWVGCVADSFELSQWYGDDRQVRSDSYQVDRTGLPMLRFLLDHLAVGEPPLRRITMVGRLLTSGIRDAANSFVAHCQTTSDIAGRLGLQDDVRRALPHAFERWDGKGVPAKLRGEEIEPVMRVVQIADDAEVYCRIGGVESALAMLRQRSGTEFDPALVDVCVRDADRILGDVDGVDAWSVVIDGCSALDRRLDGPELKDVLTIFADYADLKSTWFLGHSRATAALAAEAAGVLGLRPHEVETVERAALISRIGVIGVSTGIWDKPGALSIIERERVRTVPYLTERVLSRQPRLAEIGALAGMCHERMDGSGYPRGLTGAMIPVAARLLAAADVYQALSEERPHRAAFGRIDREQILADEVTAGRLDAAAVRAVLAAAGHHLGRRPDMIAGLTRREVEVLVLLVRGWPNKRIAAHLSITPRTVGSHIEHIYTKIDVSTRGAAAMFAMRHGLVPDNSGN
ncbi:HD domain-containing phosphohydrolase [Antrihabitans cavernicola]|uniref:LuxR family transcriptional regulator n=1 Tax=Antrihabitans cavernicola TaxID=2495913 RepID=A0A5A7SI73_9NOCA|nr:HD domain-containing phosphohydrolase [Spelaeibacter cavernicola]KAA0024195.1 LuxR family transcriptional regulator [Spelaeibacter cavernicola]